MKKRFAVLYSLAPHFRRSLLALREEEPDSHITLLLPPGFPQEVVEGCCDEILALAPASSQRRSLKHAWRLIRYLRRERFDCFIVFFNSPALWLLTQCSGARECAYFSQRGARCPMSMSFLRSVCALAGKRIRGRYMYYKIKWDIYRHPFSDTSRAAERKEQDGDS
ncbi:MAG TPA: hypothetical protein PLY90_05050 [Candidatus Hydrogenedentes bacterium]|mgnify:FL=1|jgi:ADP-heptose:LPS heptosyltransferase|nr:hypothetical protein [Candidatus Hydrogenedentota bacterium]HQB02646.1 hypothetical protein [Candidatus Hydrogenedentota bacterium]